MAEALATGLALEAAKTLTMLVSARVVEELKLACWGFNDQLETLRNRFAEIQAFLEDLGSAKYAEKSKFVNLWLKKLTDVAYFADELMDDYEYELLRTKVELKINHPSFKKKCNNFLSPATNPVVFRIRMSCRVREILSKLDELDNEAIKNGLQKVSLAREAVASNQTVGYSVDNLALQENRKHAAARGSDFIGRMFDEEKLLHMILHPSAEDAHHLFTLAIVGIGGLGKTTLSRKLYEQEQIDDRFEKTKFWICVSENFKVDRFLNEMIERLTSTKCDLTNTDAITNKLQKELKGKKFFLVLDDVWESNQALWDSFKNALLLSIGDLRGCVMLITTRSIDVADKARVVDQHKLEGLSEDEGWVLLHQTVFNKPPLDDSPYEGVGRRIVNNKCKGVPLAIKAIGGILLESRKLSYEEWESIESSELWDSKLGDAIDILPSLLLSYNHLNHVYVKQCFAYCAIFPKDSEMEKHQLITLWLAQGFLHDESATSNSTWTLELVGERYFNVLLNHSFLEEDNIDDQGRIWYKMHDLVHDLATYVSQKDLLEWKDGIKQTDERRHLMFNLAEREILLETFTQKELRSRRIRTISFRNGVPDFSCNIRTLILADIYLYKVPSSIEKLIHLRYLDLSYNSRLEAIPESICKLYQLQTLRIIDCYMLNELPRELHRLEKLRHIEINNNNNFLWASRRLGQLANLQTLPPLELRDGEGSWSIDELGTLHQLKGNMFIRGLEHVESKEAARQVDLGRKDKIVALHLEWNAPSQVNNDEDVLDSLEPHPNLQSLSVERFMGVRFLRG